MDDPPAALDFTPNVADGVADAAEIAACPEPAPNLWLSVADGVADAAENAACPEPAPNLSSASAGRATRGAGAVDYADRLQRRVSHGHGVVTR